MARTFRLRNVVACSIIALSAALSASTAQVYAQGGEPLTRDEFLQTCRRLGYAAPNDAVVEQGALGGLNSVAQVRRLCQAVADAARRETLRRAEAAARAGEVDRVDPEAALNAFAVADRNQDLYLSSDEVIILPDDFRELAVDRDANGRVSMQEYLQSSNFAGLDTGVSEVVAVGSLIRGASESVALPAALIGRAELEARGSPTVGDVIRDLSEVGNVQSQSARGTNAGGYGVESINLRNLSAGRTLLTLDGRRIADDPSGSAANVTGGAQQNAANVPLEQLRQTEVLKSANNGFSSRYSYAPPAAFQAPGTERYAASAPNPIKVAAEDPVSTFSIDVDTASYSNVRRFLREGQRPPVDAVRVEELINYFDYGYARPQTREEPFRPFVSVVPSPWSPGKQLMHIGVQGYLPTQAERPPLNLVFLVDTSGSMASADRLPLAQRTLNLLIDQLRPQDKVSMVAYAGSAGVVLRPTAGKDKLRMRLAVESLQSGGSTAGGAGLSLAYALAQENIDPQAVNRVILMTDGDFNVGVTDNKTLEQYIADKRQTGVYLSIYGYGRGNYQDERMQTLAQNGNGTAAYIDTLDEARRLLRDDFDGAMIPIADDVKIQVEFNPAVIAEYRLIGYETRMLRREDFNNDAVDAGEVGAGVSVTALYEITPVGGPVAYSPLRFAARATAAPPEVAADPEGEMAFLQIRYKLPGGATSRLIQQPIDRNANHTSLQGAPESTRWAAAVAAYGQMLRRDRYVPGAFTWDDTLNLAQGARGDDELGLRAEFIQLIRAAREMSQRNAGL